MATLEWNLTCLEDVTLVVVIVYAETTQQIRLESELAPVWPPRREGVPRPGWDGASFEGVVEDDEPLVVGYATPADPVEPPATVTAAESESDGATAQTLVRALGDASPPRDAVPTAQAPATDSIDESSYERPAEQPKSAAHGTSGSASERQPAAASDSHTASAPAGEIDQFEWGSTRCTGPDADEDPAQQRTTTATSDAVADGGATEEEAEDALEEFQQRLSALEQRLDAVEAAATTPE